jgi:hypothetical protein
VLRLAGRHQAPAVLGEGLFLLFVKPLEQRARVIPFLALDNGLLDVHPLLRIIVS